MPRETILDCENHQFKIVFDSFNAKEEWFDCSLYLSSTNAAYPLNEAEANVWMSRKDLVRLIAYLDDYLSCDASDLAKKRLETYVPEELYFQFSIAESAYELLNAADETIRAQHYDNVLFAITIMLRHFIPDKSSWFVGIECAVAITEVAKFRNQLIDVLVNRLHIAK